MLQVRPEKEPHTTERTPHVHGTLHPDRTRLPYSQMKLHLLPIARTMTTSSLVEHTAGELALFLPCPVLDCPKNVNNAKNVCDPTDRAEMPANPIENQNAEKTNISKINNNEKKNTRKVSKDNKNADSSKLKSNPLK
ncbi:hypothetical protein TNIN_84701 [Trichonephila inaurata madagascariensis]|uniref:Uncharacterized protein n=1 Tax=Trichonephila inaurata madagascariensis TaxID=2747483 RepID=A0A8X6XY53_9ARAC|nr:hypothetical protein TNIN_84701 [Trichonephila inaurata madagascariensis]